MLKIFNDGQSSAAPDDAGGDQPEQDSHLVARITGLRLDGRSVLHVGKRRIALQLFWQPRSEKLDIRTQAEKTAGRSQDYDRYALFADGKQIGFGSAVDSLAPGMLAGATMFDEQLGRNWLACFQIGPSAWWVVSHREGLVYDDIVVTDESDARLALMNHLQAPDWITIIAPGDWHVPDAVDRTLAEVIGRKGSVIKPVSFIKTYGSRIALGVVALVLAGAGYYAYTLFQDYQRAQEEALMLAQAERQRASMPKVVPYDKLPDLPSFVQDCQAQFEDMVMLAPGWSQLALKCQASAGKITVETGWTRTNGRIQYLIASKPENVPAEIDLDSTGNRASLAYAAEVEPGNLGVDPWSDSDVERKLNQRFQALGLTLNMRPSIQRLTLLQQQNLKDPVYNYHEIEITTSGHLEDYIRLVSDVPLAAPQSLEYDLAQSRWRLIFRVYHPPIMPLPRSDATEQGAF